MAQNSRKHFTVIIDELCQIYRGGEENTRRHFFKIHFYIGSYVFCIKHLTSGQIWCFYNVTDFSGHLLNMRVYQFARAGIIKYHSLGTFKGRNLFSHHCGAWKSKIKVSAGLFSPKASLLLQMAISSLSPHVAFLLCAHTPSLSLFSYKDISHIRVEPHPTGLILTYLFKELIFKYNFSLRY